MGDPLLRDLVDRLFVELFLHARATAIVEAFISTGLRPPELRIERSSYHGSCCLLIWPKLMSRLCHL
jgi:hypothetical protein